MSRITNLIIIVGTLIIAACSENELSIEELRAACLDATRNAIQIEIRRHEQMIERSPDTIIVSRARKRMTKLRNDERKFDSMNGQDYVLPKEISLKGRYTGGQIFFEGQTKSGPVYEVVGSVKILKEDDTGAFRCYLLYPRWSMFISGNYVYVFEHKQPSQ